MCGMLKTISALPLPADVDSPLYHLTVPHEGAIPDMCLFLISLHLAARSLVLIDISVHLPYIYRMMQLGFVCLRFSFLVPRVSPASGGAGKQHTGRTRRHQNQYVQYHVLVPCLPLLVVLLYTNKCNRGGIQPSTARSVSLRANANGFDASMQDNRRASTRRTTRPHTLSKLYWLGRTSANSSTKHA